MCSSLPVPGVATCHKETQRNSTNQRPPVIALQAFTATTVKRLAHAVPHYYQHFEWDCGLACALMVLHALGLCHFTTASLRALCPATSIWTIDLAHLLRSCGLRVSFCTVTLGVRPDYGSHRYYGETALRDRERIDRLFQEAPGAGIAIHQCSVPLQRLQALMLDGMVLAIVLVDSSQLSSCGGHGPQAAAPSWSAQGYSGHYIVLCGYDARRGEFEVRDPACERLRLPAQQLDVARRAYGTDEDLLLISNDPGSVPV